MLQEKYITQSEVIPREIIKLAKSTLNFTRGKVESRKIKDANIDKLTICVLYELFATDTIKNDTLKQLFMTWSF